MNPMPPADAHRGDALHPRALDHFPELAQLAAELLRKPPALLGLTESEARGVVGVMQLLDFPKGAMLLRENDASATGYLLLVLSGEVSVEIHEGVGAGQGTVPISVLGPGALLGEMSLIDGEPRSTNCTALSPVQAAGLSRKGLEVLLDMNPRVAAKLMAEVASIIANRLRALSDQLRLYAQLAEQQQREIDRLR
jgi:CRP-like cAMP-binding protein